MRKIREVLRLYHERGLSQRQIAASCRLGKTAVHTYIRRTEEAGLSWPLPEELDDAALEARVFPGPGRREPGRGEPDWAQVERELARKGVTRRQLWLEYRAAHPDGYDYSWFCEHYARHRARREPTMRQPRAAGEAMFVDYAGQTVALTDAASGTVTAGQVFVAVLGASQLIYTEVSASQASADWLGAHIAAFAYYGGVTETVVPDNLKSGVNRAHRYDPEINVAYAELAGHYGVAVVPARAGRPQDKALVENAVGIVEREILAPLREATFFSLAEANAAIRQRLEALNTRAFTRSPDSRRERFEAIERGALRPLPSEPYEAAVWRRAKVASDYHVVHARHAYSVPHRLIGESVELRITRHALEVVHGGVRVAVHPRCDGPGTTTQSEHMPPAHRAYASQDAAGLIRWAEGCGPSCRALLAAELEQRPLRLARRLGEGLQHLARLYGSQRLEAACARAAHLGVSGYTRIEAILKQGLDRQALPAAEALDAPVADAHANVRGAGYYH